MKYRVHYSGYYSYDVDVEANNREDAIKKANSIYDNASIEDYSFEAEDVDVWENQ